MTVSQLVKSATGADDVSVIADRGLGMFVVMTARKDAYGRMILRQYRAVVRDGELKHLRGL